MTTEGQKRFLSRLDALSREDRFCNINIEFSDGHRKFNRLVLACLSPFFDAMLSSAMQESQTGLVKLPTVNSEIFESVVQFYITGFGELDESVLFEAVDVAEMMQMPDLKQLCVKVMKDKITPENCLMTWQVSQKYTTDKMLETQAFNMACENFKFVSCREEFTQLSKENVLKLIRLKHIATESAFLDAVLFWIESNNPEETDAVAMIKKIRFPLVEPKNLLQNLYRDGILSYQEVRKLMNDRVLQNLKPDFLCAKRATEFSDVIIVCSHSKNSFNVHAWDIKRGKWYDLSLHPQDEALEQFAVAFVDQKIVITGGLQDAAVAKCLVFNATENAWTVGPQLVQARFSHGSVALPNSVYVIGGLSVDSIDGKRANEKYLDLIEEWSLDRKSWSIIGNLPKAVANAAVVPYSHFILVICGDQTFPKGNTNDIQCFNTETKCSYIVKQNVSPNLCKANICGQIVHMFSYNWLQTLYLDIHDNMIKVTLSTDKHSFCFSFSGYSLGGVIVDDKVVLFSRESTKVIPYKDKSATIQTLPTLPGSIITVHHALRARIASICLSDSSQ